MSQNIKCQMVEAQPGPDCPNGGTIVIVPGAELRGSSGYPANANFPDALRIKSLWADLYFRPAQDTAFIDVGGCYTSAAQANHTTYMRIGLKKSQGPQSQAGVPDALNPLNNGANPSELSDWVDGQWIQLWEHVWDPAGMRVGRIANADFSCCTAQAGYTVPPIVAGESAGYIVPPAVCVPCGDVEDPAVSLSCEFQYAMPKWWHLRIRRSRPIVLKENDYLSFYFGWEKLEESFDIARQTQQPMQFFGGVKLLLES